MQTPSSIVLILTMMAQNYWLQEVNPYWEFMMKWRGKKKLNSSNQMLLIIVTPIESFAQNSIEILNSSISFTAEDGTQLLLHGTWELESPFKMCMAHLLEVMAFQTVEWICLLPHGDKMTNSNNGNPENVN